jgi:hypothetical protein
MIGPLLLDLLCILMMCDILQGRQMPGHFPLPVIIAITTVWPPVGLWLLWRWWRMTRIREVLSVQRDVLIITSVDFLWDRVEQSPLAEIRNLRYSRLGEVPFSRNDNPHRQLGVINFDYGRFWHGFGMYLTVVDCRELIGILKTDYGVHTADAGYQSDLDILLLTEVFEQVDGTGWTEE